jgi:hypothetical protein
MVLNRIELSSFIEFNQHDDLPAGASARIAFARVSHRGP